MSDISYNVNTCPVCYHEIAQDCNIVITKCKHTFCFECIARILSEHRIAVCPICREELNSRRTIENTTRVERGVGPRVNVDISLNNDVPNVNIQIDENINQTTEWAMNLIRRAVLNRLSNN